jgi:hypothetical protein
MFGTLLLYSILFIELYLGLGYFCQLDFKIQNIRHFLYSTVLIKLHAIKNQIYNRKLPKLLSSTVMRHLFSFILKNLAVH